jgi:uncharacterized glyoxalase superfamily protein PhnB/uncharacterized protein YndB with AHSA1/START domain
MATATIQASSADETFVISRVVDAPRDSVYAAWTQCELLSRWWGPKGFTVTHCDNDPRPGGTFHYGLRTPTGQVMWGKWRYREVVAPERLVFISSFSDEAGGTTRHPGHAEWPLEMLSVITFAERDDGRRTEVTVRWTAHEASEAERKVFLDGFASMRAGWGGTMDQFADFLMRSGAARRVPVIPYLTVRGADAAIAFYGKAFGAVELLRLPAQDGQRVMHAHLGINGASVFLGDEFPEQCGPAAPATDGPAPPVGVVLDLASSAEVDATFRRAVEAGATAVMEPSDQFWGARFAVLRDPFGHRWMLNAALAAAGRQD